MVAPYYGSGHSFLVFFFRFKAPLPERMLRKMIVRKAFLRAQTHTIGLIVTPSTKFYAECHYAECRGVSQGVSNSKISIIFSLK
jgi:hypothetical protein